eukprot:368471_1
MHGAPITVGKFIENKQEIVEEKEKSEISGNRQQISVEMVEMIDIPCKRREIEEKKYTKESMKKIRGKIKQKRCCESLQCSINIGRKKLNKSQPKYNQAQRAEQSIKKEQGKNIPSNDDSEDKQELWQTGTRNPDHLLAMVHAANKDFQAKMANDSGSYLVQEFVNGAVDGLMNRKVPFIGEIFKTIQEKLGQKTQLPIFTWNNSTENIRFNVNVSNDKFEIPPKEQSNELEIANKAIQKLVMDKENDEVYDNNDDTMIWHEGNGDKTNDQRNHSKTSQDTGESISLNDLEILLDSIAEYDK